MNDEGGQRWPLASFNATVDAQDLRREWEEWHRSFELIVEMKNIQSQHEKLVMLLAYGGRGLQRIFYSLKPTPEEIVPEPVKVPLMPPELPEYDNAIKRLQKFFVGKRNDRVELEVFRSLRQTGDESFNRFILRLRTQAARCEFGEREEKEILHQVTMGARDERVRDKGLEDVMDLDDLTSYAINREILTQQREKAKSFRQEETVASVKPKGPRQGAAGNRNPNGSGFSKVQEGTYRPMNREGVPNGSKFGGQAAGSRTGVECHRCGSWKHDGDFPRCPALGTQCHRCRTIGHFARKCDNVRAEQRKTARKRPWQETNALADTDGWNEEMPRRPKPEDVSKVE